MKKVMVLGLMAVALLVVSPVLFAADTEKPKDDNKGKNRGPQLTDDQKTALQPAIDKFTPEVKTFKDAVAKVLTDEGAARGYIMATAMKGMPPREGKEPPKAPELTDDQKKALEAPTTAFEKALADFKADVAKVITDKDQANRVVMRTIFQNLGRPGGGKGKGKDKEAPAEGAK
jgi:hypothetical protein